MNLHGKEPLVMIISSSVGAGHNQAAVAIMDALKSTGLNVEIEMLDALDFVPSWFSVIYAGGYKMLVTKFPELYGWGYRISNQPKGGQRTPWERMRLQVEWYALRKLRKYLLQRRPTLVLATHYLATPMIGRLINDTLPALRMLTVITDNESHRFWYAQNVEKWFVANKKVRDEIIAWDIEPKRIIISGIPVHKKWTTPLDKEKVLRDWNLPPDRPIVILTGGAHFTVGPIEQIARGILSTSNAHLIVLTGANKRLLAKMARWPQAGKRMTLISFTNLLNELCGLASVVITKAGGLITSECIARGVPMVLTRPVPGQEAANAELLAREGAALVASTAWQVVQNVKYLLESDELSQTVCTNARRLFKPATDTIVSTVIEMIQQPASHADSAIDTSSALVDEIHTG